jgi:hypothetical protein
MPGKPLLLKLFAGFLAAHGVVHVIGFAINWRLASSNELSYTTDVFGGHVDVGTAGIRLIGALWLLAAAAYIYAAILVWRHSPLAIQVLLGATALSALLCLTKLSGEWFGLVIDIVLFAGIAALPSIRSLANRRGSAV